MEMTEPREGPGRGFNNVSCSLYCVEVQVRGDSKNSLTLDLKLHRTLRLVRVGVLEGDITLEMSDHDRPLSVSRKEVPDGRGAG